MNRIFGGRDYIGFPKDYVLMEPIYNPNINAVQPLDLKELEEKYKMGNISYSVQPVGMNPEPQRFPINGTPLWVEFNPKGSGLLLCVPRGISCEGHVQLFSAHTNNTPESSFIVAELEKRQQYYRNLWGSLCSLVDDIGYIDNNSEKPFREDIGGLVCNFMIRKIAENAEKAYNEHCFS